MGTKETQSTNLEKTIEKMAIGGRNQFSDCFANFLDLALSFFCNNMDERQMELRAKAGADRVFQENYIEAITAFGDNAEDYHDPLGDIFMSRISHGDYGQFFTPESVSLLMSEILMGDKVHDGVSINDPACGTGRTLLMALKHLRERKGVEPKLYANDLSMTCSKMTLLNFCYNLVDGMVTCGDALTLDYDNFTFYKLDKLRNLTSGAVFTTYWRYTTADAEKVQEKREKWWLWVAEHGWIKYYNIPKDLKMFSDPSDVSPFIEMRNGNRNAVQNDPLPTEIKTDENGQLKLFN